MTGVLIPWNLSENERHGAVRCEWLSQCEGDGLIRKSEQSNSEEVRDYAGRYGGFRDSLAQLPLADVVEKQ